MSRQASRQEKIQYIPTDDEGVGALAIPDFSLAFHSSKLGNALCYSNPMEDKFLLTKYAKIERQKKKTEKSLYHNQRNFFIRQVFEKGLNPYLKDKNPTLHRSMTEASMLEGDTMRDLPPNTPGTSRASGTARITDMVSLKLDRHTGADNLPDIPRRSHTIGDLRSSGDSKTQASNNSDQKEEASQPTKKVVVSLPKLDTIPEKLAQQKPKGDPTKAQHAMAPEGLPALYRSGTMISIPLPKRSGLQTGMSHSFGFNPSQLPSDSDEDEDETGQRKAKTCRAGNEDDDDDIHMDFNLLLESYRNSEKRDIQALTKDPLHMFPMMNSLISGPSGMTAEEDPFLQEMEEMLTARRQKLMMMERKLAQQRGQHTPRTPRHKKKKQAEKGKEALQREQLKLIQKLTTYLPKHLAERAEEEIRKMSNSEAIYEFKKQILDINKTKGNENVTIDPRWQKLQNTLCPTRGLGKKWRKSHKNVWVFL